MPPGTFLAELAEWDGKKFESAERGDGDGHRSTARQRAYTVAKVEQKDRAGKAAGRRSPPARSSSRPVLRLHFAAKRTMMTAQKLYEGVELGSEGSVALITYMRTDSTRISDEALKTVRKHIGDSYGDAYLPDKPNPFKSARTPRRPTRRSGPPT